MTPQSVASSKQILRKRFPCAGTHRFGTPLLLAIVALAQCYTSVHFAGQNVDESEVVAYAVGFLGGDLNPHWFGYGSFPLYLLSLVYFSVWAGGHAVGIFGSLESFASLLVSDDALFYAIARYLFALVGVVTLWLYARTLRHLGVPATFAGGYFLLAALHPTAVGYANFIKIDHLVGLYFAVAVHVLLQFPGRLRTLVVISALSALALTTKVSAAPILALLAVALLCNYWSERNWRWPLLAALVFLALLFVTQPFSNPVSVIIGALRSHAGDQLLTLVRPHYDNMGDRFLVIGALAKGYLSSLNLALALLLPFGLVREVRKGFCSLLLVAILIVSPFIIASDIQPYWMIPVYPILLALVFLAAWGFFQSVRRFSQSTSSLVLVLALSASLLQAGIWTHALSKHWISPDGISNRVLAAEWLESHALGSDVVVLERSHSNLMPEVHDLSSLSRSRDATRLLIFNRRENSFLSGLFDSFLVSEYPNRVASMKGLAPRQAHSLAVTLRLRARGTLSLASPRICDSEGQCSKLRLTSSAGVDISSIGDTLSLITTAPRQELRFLRDEPLVLDGSSRLGFDLEGLQDGPGSVAIGVNGNFRDGDLLHLPSSGLFSVPLFQFGKYPWLVNLREPEQVTDGSFPLDRRVLMVTSPAIYNRYRVLDPAGFEGSNRERVIRRQSFYRSIIGSSPLVKLVAQGSGAPIEIYDITALARSGTSDVELTHPESSVIWFVPSSLSRCAADATVMVHWDASSVPGVTRVHVRTVRPNGSEGEFAASGPIGSKPTGPWMAAGRQLILRDADDGRELGRATLAGTACEPTRTSKDVR